MLGFGGENAREKVIVLFTMCFALAMAMLDNTVVNIAIPTIQRELGDSEDGGNELTELEERIAKTKLSKEARTKADAELKKLKQMSPMSAEATVVRNYLDWLVGLPWGKKSKVKKDLVLAEEVLEHPEREARVPGSGDGPDQAPAHASKRQNRGNAVTQSQCPSPNRAVCSKGWVERLSKGSGMRPALPGLAYKTTGSTSGHTESRPCAMLHPSFATMPAST